MDFSSVILCLFAVFAASRASMGNIPNSGSIFTDDGTTMPPEIDEIKVRQFFAENCEKQLNDQIKLEMEASQVYLSMSNYLDRWDVALPGFAKKYRKFSDEEREHGIKLMKYINKRGGVSKMPQILDVSQYSQYIDTNDWGDIMNVLTISLKLERLVNYKIVDFVRTCASTQNYHMENFIDEEFVTEQVDAIEEIGRLITQLKMVGTATSHVNNYGLYQLDKNVGE